MLFCNQVAGGAIQIENEASMQLHLSNILLQLGRLNIFSPSEYFNVLLERIIDLPKSTSKSKNKKARVDIWIEIKNENEECYAAAIELKYLKKSKAAAVTDARYSIYQDLENLEQYCIRLDNLMIYEVVLTDNPNFLENNEIKFSIADGCLITSYLGNKTYGDINLSRQYSPLKWDRFDRFNFLKISPIII